ncbi:MAG: CAP domain-containing protein [Deltaproteobacteria bacterium]|nr:CAP domain-containing protein [Deltaproteobacteria bacterium]
MMLRRLVQLLAVAAIALGAWLVLDHRDAVREVLHEVTERAATGWNEPPSELPPAGEGVADRPAAPPTLEPQPPPPPGTALRVELVEAPAERYADPTYAEPDRYFSRLVGRVPGLRYDPALSHAARELAAFHATEGQLAPDAVLAFFLDAGGAPEWGVEQTMRVTTASGDEPVLSQLQGVARSAAPGEPPLRVGVGEGLRFGRPATRHIAVLVSRGGLRLDPLPRRVRGGQALTIDGVVPPGTERLGLLVAASDQVFTEVPAELSGTAFRATLDVPDLAGPLLVELIGDSAAGPRPLAQLDLRVDSPLPDALETAWPPDESQIGSAAEAEAFIAGLIARDRAAAGLGGVGRDPALDAVARAHSADMARHHFFAHVSPRTGDVTDRLRAAGYRSLMHGENIARNGTLFDAQAGLMRSLGHRRNILSPDATRVGVGIAETGEGETHQWVVTQVFARPSPVVDPLSARVELVRRLDRARAEAGLPPLRLDDALSGAAELEVRRDAPTPRGVLDRASRYLQRGGFASIATLPELSRLEVPADFLEPRYRRLGIAVRQDLSRDGADILVVMVVGGG